MITRGVVQHDRVVVADVAAANRIHNKGQYGQPQSGNTLSLSLVEAAYLVHQERLRVDGASWDQLLQQAGTDVEYLGYADLRDRGLLVRHSESGFDVWNRGQTMRDKPWFGCRVMAEHEQVNAQAMDLAAGGVLSVVDEDGIVTHYRADAMQLQGKRPQVELAQAKGKQVDGRVFVDSTAAQGWLAEEGIGTPHGSKTVLSLTEAQHLRARGVLDVEPLSAPHVDVYDALRKDGVVARSGFRFGTHFRGYEGSPDEGHALWLIHCLGDGAHWSELSRGVRLAHGVRKEFVVALTEPVRFVRLAWFRP